MTTEKMRVSASSIIRSVADTSATPASMRASVPFAGMKILRRAFAGASIAWAAALPAATLVAARPALSAGPNLFAFAVYVIGSLVCHQKSERSFYLWAHQMPVCARCTGIYVGAAMTVLVSAVFAPVARRLERSVSGSPKGFALLALAPA